MRKGFGWAAAALAAWTGSATPAPAQTLGSFSWQLSPYCNVITVTVTQNGGNYTLDGYDNQCGGSTRAAVLGMAVPNPTGTVTLGFAIVTPPSGTPVHVTTAIDLGSLGGSWSDDQGNGGTFVFTPSGVGSGSPRPAATNGLADNSVTSAKIVDGAVGGLDIDPAQVQQRIQSACPTGQLMTGVNQNGTVVCEAVTSGSGGDITTVAAGTGLFGGGTTGDVTLGIAQFGVNTNQLAPNAVNGGKILDGSVGAADIDPGQVQVRVSGSCAPGQAMRFVTQSGTVVCEPVGGAGGDITAVTAGAGLSGGGSTGAVSLAVTFAGSGGMNLAARSDHTHALGSALTTAVGQAALAATGAALFNTAVGGESLEAATSAGNTALGARAGENTTTGGSNVFVGYGAGNTNTTGQNHTIVGQAADVASAGLINATALGYRAVAGASNAIVLGSIDGVNGAGSDTRVGIGTTTPGAPLEIEREVDAITGRLPELWLTSFGAQPIIAGRSANGTRATPGATQLNDELLTIRADGHIGNQFTGDGKAKIVVRATQDWGATATGAAMDFYTTLNNTTVPVQRIVITNDGLVGIGRASVTRPLDVNGDVRIGTTGTLDGCLEDRGAAVIAGTCSSDARLKTDIAAFPAMLDKVAQLRPVTFRWRADEFPERHFGTAPTFGLIAQETETVLPELVVTRPDGYKAVNYSRLPLVTLQAVTELAADQETLRAGLRDLQTELATLREALAAAIRELEAARR